MNINATFSATALRSICLCLGLVFFPGACLEGNAQNLLVNGGFENGGGGGGNGTFSFPGWTVNYYGYNYAGVTPGDASQGNYKLDMNTGGLAETADNALVPITHPGGLYRLRFDLKTYVQNDPQGLLGSYGEIYFYDASGNVLKWESTGELQNNGVFGYQTVELYSLAPSNAVTARVVFSADRGTYGSTQDTRQCEVDNFIFESIAEDSERVALRYAPLLVEPGKSYSLDIRYATPTSENLVVTLKNGGVSYGQAVAAVAAGRGLVTVTYAVPAGAPNSTGYVWNLQLGSKQVSSPAVTIDQTVSGSGNITADNPKIVFTGRYDATDPKNVIVYWYGSQILTRFQGTSVALRASSASNGYGGNLTTQLNYVIDGGTPQAATLNGTNQVLSLATGLATGTHTLEIMKADESASSSFIFQGFTLDPNCGLLAAAGFQHRLEVYGDSVTSGGTASPVYLGYAPLLGRAMGSSANIISLGGSGVAASFSGEVTLTDYWNKFNFTSAFSVAGDSIWDFSRYQPQAVVMAIGHNDQFNNGPATFTAKYQALLANLEQVYPSAQIFCTIPLISYPTAIMDPALQPLVPTDPRIHYRLERQTWTDPNTGHPPTAAHQALVYGDAYRWSLAEWIEEGMGWGLGLPADTEPPKGAAPPTGYTFATAENGTMTFSQPVDLAYGSNGSYFYKSNFTGTITFNTATFGDPTPDLVKAGYYRTAVESSDSPTMPVWGLLALGALLMVFAARSLRPEVQP